MLKALNRLAAAPVKSWFSNYRLSKVSYTVDMIIIITLNWPMWLVRVTKEIYQCLADASANVKP